MDYLKLNFTFPSSNLLGSYSDRNKSTWYYIRVIMMETFLSTAVFWWENSFPSFSYSFALLPLPFCLQSPSIFSSHLTRSPSTTHNRGFLGTRSNFTKIKVPADESSSIVLDSAFANHNSLLQGNCCYGWLLHGRDFNFRSLRTILEHIWSRLDFKVSQVTEDIFQYFFHSRADIMGILNKRPWNLDNHLFILVEETTNHFNVWVHVLDRV